MSKTDELNTDTRNDTIYTDEMDIEAIEVSVTISTKYHRLEQTLVLRWVKYLLLKDEVDMGFFNDSGSEFQRTAPE